MYIAEFGNGNPQSGMARAWIQEYLDRDFWLEVVGYRVEQPAIAWIVAAAAEYPDRPAAVVAEGYGGLGTGGGDDPMFVEIRQKGQVVEQYQLTPIPSIVWLKRLDDGAGVLGEIVASPLPPISEMFGGGGKREGDPRGFVVRQGPSPTRDMEISERPGDMVQGCSEIRHDVADYQRPGVPERGGNIKRNEPLVLRKAERNIPLGFAFLADRDAGLEKLPHASIQRIYVYLRSLDFSLGAAERVIGGMAP